MRVKRGKDWVDLGGAHPRRSIPPARRPLTKVTRTKTDQVVDDTIKSVIRLYGPALEKLS
jgi:hypothetical protein